MNKLALAFPFVAATLCLSACNAGLSPNSKATSATATSASHSTAVVSSATSSSTKQTSSSSKSSSKNSSSSDASSSSSSASSEKTYSLISGTLAMSFPTYAPDTISGNIKPGNGITVSGNLPILYCVFSGAKSNQSGKAAFVNTSSLKVYWNNGVIFRSALLDLQCTTKVKGSVQLVSGSTADDKTVAANSYDSISFTDTSTNSISYITSFNFSEDYSATGDFVAILSKISFNVMA